MESANMPIRKKTVGKQGQQDKFRKRQQLITGQSEAGTPGNAIMKEALVSATTGDGGAGSIGSSTGGGARVGGDAGPDSVNLMRLESLEAKKREEKGGGPTDEELATDASDGEWGGGAV
ncbi:hypothetical protein N7492_002890 [Penicillium capsulatum]|uniref:Uncharacterized protein n=1 Tax=Penicillium capsulatum TaxID=69766 RepID=A0A9W9LW39_9EURO|nr:hypothetical protein N7492_002890 [Penicillium capsulatum]